MPTARNTAWSAASSWTCRATLWPTTSSPAMAASTANVSRATAWRRIARLARPAVCSLVGADLELGLAPAGQGAHRRREGVQIGHAAV